jgi:hypothetical protein
MGLGKKNHCDFVEIEVAYNLMEKLGLKNKEEFARMCGLTGRTQFYRWEKKGRMPAIRLNTLKEELMRVFKKEFDDKCKILGY